MDLIFPIKNLEVPDIPKHFDDIKLLFYDEFSNRYFETFIRNVYEAEIYVNKEIYYDYVSINDIYEILGLELITDGDHIGWCHTDIIQFIHKKIKIDNDLECYSIRMLSRPTDISAAIPF